MGISFTLILAFLVFIVICVFSCGENASWTKFKLSHNCKEIGTMEGSLDWSGNYTSGKIGYRCDDGKEYWRSK